MIDKKERKIIGILGMGISLIGFVLSLKHKKKILAGVFALSFLLYGWVFYTGTKNYALVMFGAQDKDFNLESPVIQIFNKSDLKDFMAMNGKNYLWLPCSSGGDWYKQKAFFYTRWNLPDKSVQCPNGRYLIKYDGESL